MTQQLFAAPCKVPGWTPPEAVTLKSDSVLLVTHPSTVWDGRFASKVGMDAAVLFAKKKNIPVIYLEGDRNQETYFFSDCKPTYWVMSFGGEFSFAVTPNHVYSVGGHWELCQQTTMDNLMNAWKGKHGVDLTLTQVLDGLYNYGAYVSQSDPYAADFKRFMEIVTYRKPSDDSWTLPKLNMLEMMGVIKDEAREIAYLKRNLPPYERLDASYEVQLVVNGKMVEVLRKGTGAKPPVLRLEFQDSLYEGGYAPSFKRRS